MDNLKTIGKKMSLSDYNYSPELEAKEQTKLSKAQIEEAVKQTRYNKRTFWVTVLILLLTIVLVLREFAIL